MHHMLFIIIFKRNKISCYVNWIFHVSYFLRLFVSFKYGLILLRYFLTDSVLHKDIFACLFSTHNTISLSCHEQVCLSSLSILVHGMIVFYYCRRLFHIQYNCYSKNYLLLLVNSNFFLLHAQNICNISKYLYSNYLFCLIWKYFLCLCSKRFLISLITVFNCIIIFFLVQKDLLHL